MQFVYSKLSWLRIGFLVHVNYGLNVVQCGVSAIKESVRLCFEQKVQF